MQSLYGTSPRISLDTTTPAPGASSRNRTGNIYLAIEAIKSSDSVAVRTYYFAAFDLLQHPLPRVAKICHFREVHGLTPPRDVIKLQDPVIFHAAVGATAFSFQLLDKAPILFLAFGCSLKIVVLVTLVMSSAIHLVLTATGNHRSNDRASDGIRTRSHLLGRKVCYHYTTEASFMPGSNRRRHLGKVECCHYNNEAMCLTECRRKR